MVTLKGYTANMLGVSTDQKPTDTEVNTIFRELDTNCYYYFDGSAWNEIPSSGGGGGSGTDNYNELSNKPSINSVTLSGNKTAANLGLQPAITGDVTISSDNVDDTGATNLFVTSTEKSTWSGKQDALTFDDTPTESSNNPVKSGGVYTALSGKQAAITNDAKLNPALIDYNSTYAAVSSSEKTTYAGKQDALTFDGTYSSSTNKAATVSTVTNAIDALDVTGAESIAASKTISAWSETDGKVSVSTQDIAITGSQAVLTGYAKTTGNVAAADTVTVAIGKLETKTDNNESNILSAYGGMVRKNRLNYDLSTLKTLNASSTWSGTTGTTNRGQTVVYDPTDNSLTVSGNSSTETAYFNLNTTVTLPAGTYRLYGCPAGGSSSTYELQAVVGGTDYHDYGSGVGFALSAETTIGIVLTLRGGSYTNIKFTPILCTIADYDADETHAYQPYIMTNDEISAYIRTLISNQ